MSDELDKEILEQTLQKDLMETFMRNYNKDGASRRTRAYYEKRLSGLQELWDKFEMGHRVVMRLKLTDPKSAKEHAYFTDEVYAEVENFFIDSYSKIAERFSEEFNSSGSKRNDESFENCVNTSHRSGTDSINLPKITLEKFNGDYNKWPTFHDLFTTMIHQNRSLSDVQRLQYLKLHLVGEPEQLLRRFQVTEKNYIPAWSVLEERYDNKRVLVNTQLKMLFTQNHLNSESASAIRKFMDNISESLQALVNLGVTITDWDPIIVYLVVQRLPHESHQLWEQEISKSKELPKWEDLKAFLETRFRTLEAIGTKTSIVRDQQRSSMGLKNKSTFHVSTVKNSTCAMCQADHLLRKCPQFLSLSPKKRVEMVRTKNLCWNCLTAGHLVPKCPSIYKCRHCNKAHHTLLHLQPDTTERTTPPSKGQDQISSNTTKVNQHGLNIESASFTPSTNISSNQIGSYVVHKPAKNHVLLATALLKVVGPSDNEVTVRALIDQGSQASFVTEKVVQILGLPKQSINATIQGLGREGLHHITCKTKLRIQSINDDTEIQVDGLVMRKLTKILPNIRIPHQRWCHIKGLQLADPKFLEPGCIDLLLGADVFANILLDGVIKGSEGMPVAQKTIFGWILSGEIHEQQHNLNVKNFMVQIDADCNLERQLKAFWEVEEFHYDVKYNDEETRCEELYKLTSTRSKDGRYSVQLPLIDMDDDNYLGRSRNIAIARLHQLENRFKSNPDLKKDYVKCLHEYQTMGHMTRVSPQELSRPMSSTVQQYRSSYLPHHAVVKQSSTTTKVRVVFDASKKTESGRSLNDVLLKGPTIQDDLLAILIRWRKHKIAFIADIEKMYRQIWVQDPFVEYQRIVWRESTSEPIQDFKLLTVTFGTKSAPYLAIKTLQQLARDEYERFPIASKITLNDFYVDDVLSGADNVTQALEAQRQLMGLMQAGGFPLKKWMSNSGQLLQTLVDENYEIALPNSLDHDVSVRALGICWRPSVDTCNYVVKLNDTSLMTKRNILSQIAKFFDPLGLLAPILISAKIIMQKLWLAGLGWDEEVPPNLRAEWTAYVQTLPDSIHKIEIKRWINYTTTQECVEIHGFSDASMKAYAGAIYICTTDESGKRSSNLVMSKTKVAPIKTISLPRLELCAATLTAKLLKYVMKSLQIDQPIKMFAWTDSQIVLAWLNSHPSRWSTFVGNRVAHIHELLGKNIWGHVPTKQNPADCASRGLNSAELKNFNLWWHGPTWLLKSSADWPIRIETQTNIEERKISVHFVNKSEEIFETNYSSFNKLLRIVSYCRRFFTNTRIPVQFRNLSYIKNDEIETSLKCLIRRAQARHFSSDLKALQQQKPVEKSSRILKLNPFIDEEHILRVGGRLKHSSLSFEQKHPIILPDKDILTKLFIDKIHKETLHGGYQLMMSVIQNRYWVINSRNLIKQSIHKCIVCFRQKAITRSQLMGELPAVRVQISRPFSHTGIDYCGPFEMKTYKGRGAKKYRAYISVFVCMATKAIHLEAVTDLTSNGFLAAFRRFCSRRGLCTDLYCDNGTNFLGASRILAKQHRAMMDEFKYEIAETLENEGVNFHFIPPSSPHFGGLWEAGVKSTKYHLKRVLANNTMTFEEFTTLLCQIEACLNSRPLCAISNDPNDMTSLTPSHFLIGDNMRTTPQQSFLETQSNRLDRYQYLQQLLQSFWRRWTTEYLNQLQQRPKWALKTPNIKVGDLVLLKDENLPPCKWLMARVRETHPGADGLIRVVTVKTSNTELKRPITKVCVLPIEGNTSPDQTCDVESRHKTT